VKKLLIIQNDDAYFLFETLQVVEKNYSSLKGFELTLFVNEAAAKIACNQITPMANGVTWDYEKIRDSEYDISVNLSLKESSWKIHSKIKSTYKLGPYYQENELIVPDLWSSYLLTLKAKAPFLTFHLQDIYKNILGLKGVSTNDKVNFPINKIVFETTSTHLFSAEEQEKLLYQLSRSFIDIPLKDISEVDLIDDVSRTLYVGPATLDSLKLCEAGGKGIFFSSGFQGHNFIPYSGDHLIVSSLGKKFNSDLLFQIISDFIKNKELVSDEYALYRIDHDVFNGSYLKSHKKSDSNYPFYQSHLVLWNFLLNLTDINLDIISCSPEQVEELKNQSGTLKKFIRLYDYAMTSIDKIHQEAKSTISKSDVIFENIKTLKEVDIISDKISETHPFLRPFLDFYRIRRGQNNGNTLQEQSQTSFLNYAEEHQALKALMELFSVTLKRNETSI
jgi:hypothetical protein